MFKDFGSFGLAWAADGMNLFVKKGSEIFKSGPDGNFELTEALPEMEGEADVARTRGIQILEGALTIEGKRVSPLDLFVMEYHLLSRGADVYFSGLSGDSMHVFRWSPISGSEQLTTRDGKFRCLPNRDGESLALVFEDAETGDVSLFRMDGPKMFRVL